MNRTTSWKRMAALLIAGVVMFDATGCKSKTTIVEPTRTVDVPVPDHHDDHHPPPPPPDHHDDRRR